MKLFVGAKGLVMFRGKLLLLRESQDYRDGAEEGRWDFPGGRIEAGEPVREGLLREVREETGLTVEPRGLLGVFDGFPEIRGESCHVVRIYFSCEAKDDAVTTSEDHDAYRWVNPAEALEHELVNDLREVIELQAQGGALPLP